MASSDATSDRHVVARIGKPHGIRGEVTVQAHTDDPEGRFVPGTVFPTRAEAGSGVPRELVLASARLHREIWLLGFEGIPDRTGAEALRGTRLLTPLTDDDGVGDEDGGVEDGGVEDGGVEDGGVEDGGDEGWYEEDLLGFAVVDLAGARLGEVTGLDLGLARDRLHVRLTDGVDALVPFVEELVPEVDERARRVVVDLPPGLLDLARQEQR